MKFDQYFSLVQSLEISAAKNRGFYQFKVFLLTILGYVYFVGLILMMFVPVIAVAGLLWLSPEAVGRLLLVTAKIWWVLIPGLGLYFGFIGSAVKSITAKVPDPDGIELTKADAAELFDFVSKTCSALRSKKPVKILVTDNFNAGVVTMPRFGIFGRKVMLLIGLPLMKALSPEQFKAVLAHEIGHISGKHGAFAKWAYQMREAWGRLIDSQAETKHRFSSLYQGFVDWFFPYFTAYSFVLMREHEKDADKEAAQLVGKQALGEALILIETKALSLDEEFWRDIHKENLVSEKPSERIFTRMVESLAFVNPDRGVSSLSKVLAVPTDFNDSHPALADRLRLIGYWTFGELPEIPPTFEMDGATYFLGAATERFAAKFDSDWDEQAKKTWKTRHEHFQESDKRVRELEEKRGELTLEELRELSQRLTEKDGLLAASAVIEEAADRFPDEAVGWYNLGLLRLAQDDETGLAHLEKSAKMDNGFKIDANQLAFDYLRGKGRIDEARKYARDIDEQTEIIQKAQKERANIFPEDKFEIHDLPKEFLDSIPPKLAGLDEVIALYAVRKVVQYMPEFPYHVLFIDFVKKGRLKNRDAADPSTILSIVRDRLNSGEFQMFALLHGQWAGTKYYLDKIPGARIYNEPRKV